MARNIFRGKDETAADPKPTTEEVAPAAIVDKAPLAPVDPVSPVLEASGPIEKPVNGTATAVEPVNVSINLAKNLDFTGIRLVGCYLLFNDGPRARRVVIEKGKPVIVTIRQ